MLKRLLATVDDPVPNVRLAALDCIFDIAYATSEDGIGMLNKASINTCLSELKNGANKANVKDDVDVRLLFVIYDKVQILNCHCK